MTEESIKTGWAIVVGVLGVLALLAGVNILGGLLQNNFLGIGLGGLLLWLCWNVYNGSVPARIWLGGLLGLMTLHAIAMLVGPAKLLALFYIVALGLLFIPPQVNDYFSYVSQD